MIPHFTESPSFHFPNWAGLSGINSNPPFKERGRGGGGVGWRGLWWGEGGGIKAERIKAARAKEEDPTEQKEEFGSLVNS